MDLDRARDFLRDQHRAVMATYRRDGTVQLSPVVTTLDDEGHAMVSTREPAVKTKNLRRDPRTSLCVLADEFFGPWMRVDGTADIVSLPDAMELLVDYYRRMAGEHDDWDDYRRAMREEQRVMVLVDLERAGPDTTG